MNREDGMKKKRAGSTLLVPVHRGREENLKELLASVAAARPCSMYPVEVLLVTKDITEIEDLISRAFPTFPIPIITRVYPGVNTLGELRNEGLRAVKTEWLHSVDSDTTVPTDYFTKLEQEMSQYGSQIKCFQLNFAPSADSSRWAQYEAEVDALHVPYAGLTGFQWFWHEFRSRPEALLSIGGFAEDLEGPEDVEMGYRLYKAGVPVVFLPEVRIIHNYPRSLSSIARRKFWHGKGYQLMRGRRPDFISAIHPPAEKEDNSSLFARKFLSPWFVLYYLVVVPAFLSGYYWCWISRKVKGVSAK
jgi:hypothetical protein